MYAAPARPTPKVLPNNAEYRKVPLWKYSPTFFSRFVTADMVDGEKFVRGVVRFFCGCMDKSASFDAQNFNDLGSNRDALNQSELYFRLELRKEKRTKSIFKSPEGAPEFSQIRHETPTTLVEGGTTIPTKPGTYVQMKYGNFAKIEGRVRKQLRHNPQSSLMWEMGLRT